MYLLDRTTPTAASMIYTHICGSWCHLIVRSLRFCLLLMALCDAERRILWHDIGFYPTTHDSTAWRLSSLGKKVANGRLPSPFFISGDNAFHPGSPSIVTPGPATATWDAFNYVQSSKRMPIECAFGECLSILRTTCMSGPHLSLPRCPSNPLLPRVCCSRLGHSHA